MKKLCIYSLALAILFLAAPTVQAATVNGAPLGAFQIYPKDYIWKAPLDTSPVDAKSSTYINSIGASTPLVPLFSDEGGLTYNVVDNSQATHMVRFDMASMSDNVPYPIPDNPLMEGGSGYDITTCTNTGEDCHLLILNTESNYLYELFYVRKMSDGTYTAFSGAAFNLSSYTLRPDSYTSADAAGLPILPGMIRYDEIVKGSIDHAIRVSAPKTDSSHIWPARSSSSDYTNGIYPSMGQRFRLKSSFDISKYSVTNQIILTAMKKYGVIVADNALTQRIGLYGILDSRWNAGDLDTLRNLHISDFEAVDASSLMINKDSGQAQIPTSTPTPTPAPTPVPTLTLSSAGSITVTSPNGGESWVRGSAPKITWTSSGDAGSSVKIEVLKAGAVVQTMSDDNDCSYNSWVMSAGLGTGTDYKVRITSVSNPAITDTSDGTFTLTPGTASSSITVTSPNGGESWRRGTSQTITWSYSGSPGSSVKIVLLKGSTQVGTIVSNTPVGSGGKGSYSWKIARSSTTGTNYKVSIQSISQPAIKDSSNNYFTVS